MQNLIVDVDRYMIAGNQYPLKYPGNKFIESVLNDHNLQNLNQSLARRVQPLPGLLLQCQNIGSTMFIGAPAGFETQPSFVRGGPDKRHTPIS